MLWFLFCRVYKEEKSEKIQNSRNSTFYIKFKKQIVEKFFEHYSKFFKKSHVSKIWGKSYNCESIKRRVRNLRK